MLSLKHVTAGYSEVPVLINLTLRLAQNEVLGVLGRNGAGKSTLVKSVMGLIPHVSGDIEFRGASVRGRRTHQIARSGLALIPQGRWIFHRLSVLENLVTGCRGSKQDTQRSLQLVYDYFPVLADRTRQMGGTLSGGEQQLLAIGRALCSRPKVLLLDEPSDGVQPNTVEKLAEVIPNICREIGVSAILVEQNLDLVMSVASRCVVLSRGEVVFEGKPSVASDVLQFESHLSL